MGSPIQMMLQAMMQGANPMQSPIMQEVMQLRQQGRTPQEAMQLLSQRYPRFGTMLQGKTPQQMDVFATNALRSAGIDPQRMMQQIQRFVR